MTPPRHEERLLIILAAGLFAFSLGTLGVAVPLLAVQNRFGLAEVGLLVAVAAVSQMATRLFMGPLMRTFPDKFFLVASGILIAASCAILALSPTLAAFVVSQLAQGVARGLFWTSSQTHAVRTSATAVGALRMINLAGGIGALLGPAAAGILLELWTPLPLVVGALAGLAAVIPAVLLKKLPPFAGRKARESGDVRLWQRSAVNASAWMNVGAGAWKGLVDSYVPVALSLGGLSAGAVGLLVAVANATVLIGSYFSTAVRRRGIRASLILGLAASGLGLAFTGPFASIVPVVAIALAVSGIGAGILQTVGPAIAADEVHPEERGDALALVGTFRASALFAAPSGMSGLVAFMPVGWALVAAGMLMALPAVLWRPTGPSKRESPRA